MHGLNWVFQLTLSRTRHGSSPPRAEMASVLWAFAKAKRADGALFGVVARELMRATEYELGRPGGGQGPKPQGT